MELNVLRLASWMRERGWNAILLSGHGSALTSTAEEYDVPVRGLHTGSKYFDVHGARHIARILESEDIRVLFVNGTGDINRAIRVKRLLPNDLKLVYVQHMQIGRSKRDIFHRWEYSYFDAWISPLKWLARQAAVKTTVPENRIHVIPFGIETSRFTAVRPDLTECRTTLGLPGSVRIAGITGRLDRGKGQEHLLAAAALLRDKGLDIDVLLIGEDTVAENQGYGAYLESLTARLGLEGHVHFRPFMKQIEAGYRAMDVFVLSSISETYGMVTIEAMLSGLPVVATNTAGTPEIIDDGTTGILVPPAEPEKLADALRDLFEDPPRMTEMGHAARNDAALRFSHDTQCRHIEELIHQLTTASR